MYEVAISIIWNIICAGFKNNFDIVSFFNEMNNGW